MRITKDRYIESNITPTWMKLLKSNTEFDIEKLITHSMYYPASGFDFITPLIFINSCRSYILADPNVTDENIEYIIKRLTDFNYRLILKKEVKRDDIYLNQIEPIKPIFLLDGDLPKFLKDITPKEFYAYWMVFEEYGPYSHMVRNTHNRFSILFISDEGVSTYQNLYNASNTFPIGIILKAHYHWTNNWTYFSRRRGIFERTVMSNKSGFPNYIISFNQNDYCEELDFKGTTWVNYQNLVHEGDMYKIFKAEFQTHSTELYFRNYT
jgi:hypothetical protein